MKKIIAAIIIVMVIAGGAYVIFHKSSDESSNGSKSSQSAKADDQSTAADVNNTVLITKTDSKLGKYLADPSGKPLYTYDKDTEGVSNCTGSCLADWPAYVAKGSTADLPAGVSTIKRTDNGKVQYTYNGLPLYYFVSDSSGNVTGNGVEDFSIAKPSAAKDSSSTDSSSQSDSSSSGSSYDYSY